MGHQEGSHASVRFARETCCSCVNVISLFFNSVISESQKKSHSMKLLWMRLCDSYFCTILLSVCVCVCVSARECVCVCMCVRTCQWCMCLFFNSQILDFIRHVDMVSLNHGSRWLFWLSHGFSIGHTVALMVLFFSFFFCLFVFFQGDFVFSFYLRVTVRCSAKTNLCPSLRDFCERCIQCFFNAVFSFVHPHLSFRQKTTVWVVKPTSSTATNGVPLSQCGVNIELGFSHYRTLLSPTLQ